MESDKSGRKRKTKRERKTDRERKRKREREKEREVHSLNLKCPTQSDNKGVTETKKCEGRGADVAMETTAPCSQSGPLGEEKKAVSHTDTKCFKGTALFLYFLLFKVFFIQRSKVIQPYV